ncbi:MAG: hypothetical protein GTO40_05470 [Deltaproteobacteria bacterium]|nr:hypothetical protein [Deltaproteobacteria bacterium]
MKPDKQSREQPVSIKYKFVFSNKAIREFDVRLDGDTLSLISQVRSSYPEWTRLTFGQCPNCPLDPKRHPHCPIALNVVDIVDFFKNSISYEKVDVEIVTESRNYVKRADLQAGISSMLGIYMVTSGCPLMDKLRPMVKTHLPFATPEETIYRILSMYLLAQYFVYKEGQKPDWDLEHLQEIYEQVQIVNRSFCQRLAQIKIKDASLNAVVSLDSFASLTTFSLELDQLDRVKGLFHSYLSSKE